MEKRHVMIRFFYSFTINLYGCLIRIVSPFNQKAKLWIAGRKKWHLQLTEKLANNTKFVVWIHCSSLGEFEQGRPIIEELIKKTENVFIFLTFFSPSGYEIRKNYQYANYVCYLPLDTKKNAKQFVSIVNPKVAIFVKYEFWYNYLYQLKKNGTVTWLVSAIFREQQHFFKKYGKWFRKQLANFEHFFVQNNQSENLLKKIGYTNVTTCGDTRFDRVLQVASQAKQIKQVEKFKDGKFTVIAGSSWHPDEDILADYINNLNRDIKYIIAPHEIDNKHIETLLGKIKKKAVLYSDTDQKENLSTYNVLIINNMGMLSSLYQYGDIAFIGGGFGKGIHNILEPAVFGLPIITGPKYEKFNEAVELVKLGTMFPVKNSDEFKNTIENLLDNTQKLLNFSIIQKEYVKRMSGSTEIIVEKLVSSISKCNKKK